LPALWIVLAFIVMNRLGAKWNVHDFGLGKPRLGPMLLWYGIYVAWMLASNALWHWRGPWDFEPWKQASLMHDAGRVLAVGILGPIGEELFFRAILYRLVAGTRLGVPGAIGITSAIWAPLHYSYSWDAILIIFVSAIMLGLARHYAKSVWAPTAMHITWNLFAVW
jgi:membrane protease YdiL (CAAX protease family)